MYHKYLPYIRTMCSTNDTLSNNTMRSFVESFECPIGYAKCPNSYCIDVVLLCDGQHDCPQGEDEIHCGNIMRNEIVRAYFFVCISLYIIHTVCHWVTFRR